VIRLDPRSPRLVAAGTAVILAVAACTSVTTDDDAGAATDAVEDAVATTAPAPAGTTPEAAAAAASWLDIRLTDARTGETFTLASLGGGVVAIEPMAIWCPSCRSQQDRVKEVYGDIEASGVTFISLGIDPSENADQLARYADRLGYGWTFVQSSTELSRALADRFGTQILSPPSTPLIVLDAAGEVAKQEFGSHSPSQVLEILAEAAGPTA
jgi:thiol-disulfide isomerase/thioredoxin